MPYKRENILQPLKENLARKVHVLQILTGPRQVGKTTAVHQLLDEWPFPHLYLTADQLKPPDVRWIASGWRQARSLKRDQPLLVIDEVQKIPRWSEAVKMLHDEDVRAQCPLRVILLGSSTLLLQRGMTESLAGRFQLIHCPHWSYPECHQAFGWTLDQYLFFGGYPGAAPYLDHFTTWRDYIQNSLLETVIGRDIPTLHRVDAPALFRQTLYLACQHPAEIVSLQKLLGHLQDRGSINTLANYLELIAAAFLVQPIRKWSERPLRVRVSSPKLIVRNNALINALRNVPYPDAFRDRAFYGRLVENAVGASFVNHGEEVFYWNDRDKEVDFVIRRGTRVVAIEVTTGASPRSHSLKTFLTRFPGSESIRIGGEASDLSIQEFFETGIP